VFGTNQLLKIFRIIQLFNVTVQLLLLAFLLGQLRLRLLNLSIDPAKLPLVFPDMNAKNQNKNANYANHR
ncbi:hypothetical protein L0P02_13715, partial [Bifidobacterium longum]|nr:hypothetical protein [Bifidobacterium longum]